MRLLEINCYDKYAETRRWIDEARRWLPDWRVRVDCNGSPDGPFHSDELRQFPNRGAVLGTYDAYRFDARDCDLVASVHAKCWLSDPSAIDRLANEMEARGAEAAVIPSPHFSPGMNLHLFLVEGHRWPGLVERLPEEADIWPEVTVLQAIRGSCRSVWEIPTGMWQCLPRDHLPNINDEGGRILNGYRISHLNGEERSCLVSTELVDHPARRR